jgi:glutamate 5-kinase
LDHEKDIVVVKYGSSTVTNEHGADIGRIAEYAKNFASVSENFGLVAVISGSIATGRAMWEDLHGESADHVDEQCLAGMGNSELVVSWQNELRKHGLAAGGIEVTHNELNDYVNKKAFPYGANEIPEGNMFRQTLHKNLRYGIISLVNENDALSRFEIAQMQYGGDNDGLASHVARALKAKHLCLLTDVDGVYKDGEVVPEIGAADATWLLTLSNEANSRGRGGMYSKCTAALAAAADGLEAHIANAGSDLEKVLQGEEGTYFVPHTE